MANVDAPRGFTPVGTMSGSDWGGHLRAYQAAAADIFVGDMLTLNASGNVTPAATASVDLVGVCVGFLKTPPANTTTGLLENDLSNGNLDLARTWQDTSADGQLWCLVVVGPDVLYEVQSSGTIALTEIGMNANTVTTTGDTLTGRSKHELDATTVQTTTHQLRIVGLAQRVGNDVTTDNAKWVVRINENHYTKLVGI